MENGRVHPDCVNASNPYHECAVACLEKIAQGQGKRQKKKSGSSILGSTLSFGRKNKGSESQRNSPQVVNNFSAAKPAYHSDTGSPRSPLSLRKKVESDNSQSFSSSHQHSEGRDSRYGSSDKEQLRSSESITSGNVLPERHKFRSNGSFTCFAIASPTTEDENEKRRTSLKAHSGPIPMKKNVEEEEEEEEDDDAAGPVESMKFPYSFISRASEESDDEVQSVISDSCVSVGKYHVRANFSTILQLIFDKYGDIAANCVLESASMRSSYLECLCSVVQELQSLSFKQLTRSKIKEMLAVLNDVESVRIDVSRLHSTLDELSEAVELNSQHQTCEAAKTNNDQLIESTKKELEPMVEDLAKKEKELADAKTRVTETRARLSELELESSKLSDTITSIRSKVGKFNGKSLADEIL